MQKGRLRKSARLFYVQKVLACLFAGCLLLSAPLHVSAQQEPITVQVEKGTLEEALNKLRSASGSSIVYQKNEISGLQVAAALLEGKDVEQLLKKLLEGLPLVVEKNGTAYFIKKKTAPVPNVPGRVTGRVVDKVTGEALPGVTIRIGKNGFITNADGNFNISLPAGKHTFILSYTGYDNRTIEVTLENDATVLPDVTIQKNERTLAGVEVTADRIITTNNIALLNEIRRATGVASGISSEQITISVDRSASEVVRRISGVTLQDGFISVRGMTPRYNPVFLNNAYLPSTEPNKRAFNFDLLPSNVIDRILVYKTAAPELPADFAGGVVKVFTKKSISVRRLELTLNGQYRTDNKQFGNHVTAADGKYDWLGVDDGTRALPANFPRDEFGRPAVGDRDNGVTPYHLTNARLTEALLERSARSWDISEKYKPMDIMGDATYYTYANVGKAKLNSVSVLRYEKQNSYYRSEGFRNANRYNEKEFPADGKLTVYKDEDYRALYDSVFTENVRLSAMQHLSLVFNKNHDISLMGVFNRNTKDALQIYTLTEWNASTPKGLYPRRIESAYTVDELTMGVLSGSHKMGGDRHSIEWNTSYAYGTNYAPNQFSNIYMPDPTQLGSGMINGYATLHPTDTTRWVFYGFPSDEVIGRFSDGEGIEKRWQGTLDYTFQLAPGKWEGALLRAGAYVDDRRKDYIFMPLSYRNIPRNMPYTLNPWRNTGETLIEINNGLPIADRIYTVIQRGGAANATEGFGYRARVLNSAGYMAAMLPFRFRIGERKFQWDVYGGVRAEYLDRSVLALNGKPAGEAPQYTLKWLPSVNTTLHLSPTLQWRMAYGQTVNRPELRELADIITYDPSDGYSYMGNSRLFDATVDNYDLRMEWYPSEGEAVIGGVYLKNIKDPIENTNMSPGGMHGFVPENRAAAKIYGLEIEVRKRLDFIEGKIFRHLGLIVNASYNYTETDNLQPVRPNLPINYYPGGKARPLQAAAPWIVNAGLFYDNKNIGSRISVQYNANSDRLINNTGSSIDASPWTFDRTRHMVDISVLQKLSDHISVRVAVQNLLNSAIRQYVDGNFNKRYDTEPRQVTYEFKNNNTSPIEIAKFIQGDYYLRNYKPGVYYTLGFQLSF